MEPAEKSDDVLRLVAALEALGIEEGPEDRATQMEQLGGVDAYRAWLASALLGAAQSEALVADSLPLSRDARYAVWERQLSVAGITDDTAARVELMQWQVQRACEPLPAMAHDSPTDPIPLAAAQAAEGLQTLLAVCAATQGAVASGDVPALAAQVGRLREALKVLQAAVDNTEELLELLGSVDL